MEKIDSVAGLKSAIQVLEDEQALKGQLLKKQFYSTYESFKPSKLIGSSLKEMISSPYLIDNVIDTGISLATGYLSRRIVVGASSNVIRRLIGTLVQVGVSKLVTKQAGNIKSVGQLAFRKIFRRRNANSHAK
jgi:hypothetical protein